MSAGTARQFKARFPKRWTARGALFAAVLKFVSLSSKPLDEITLWGALRRMSYDVSPSQIESAVRGLQAFGLIRCQDTGGILGKPIHLTRQGRAALSWFKVNE